MIPRIAKISLVFGIALYYVIALFNNFTDYELNYQYVQHTLTMDTIYPENLSMWRAVNAPAWHLFSFLIINILESVTLILCLWGGLRMALSIKANAKAFNHSKNIAIAALTLSLLMWLVVFLIVGGEWFLMWQSKTWNVQAAALRMFTVVGIVLILLMQPDSEE